MVEKAFMEASALRELVFILLSMAVLLVIAIVAVALFVRQWRREKPLDVIRRRSAPPGATVDETVRNAD